LVALAAELGVDIKFSPVRPIGRAQQQMGDEILPPAQFYQVVKQITHLRRQYPSIRLMTDFDILDEAKKNCQMDPNKGSCMAGRTSCNVNFDSYVYPCAFLVTPEREFAAGSIHESSLLELWQKAPVFQRFRTLRKSARCQSCFAYRRSCVGGCPAIAYFAMGDLEAHDPTCFIDYVAHR
jgi:radical SAM protein with 4Fe4S-binding SPASM domain